MKRCVLGLVLFSAFLSAQDTPTRALSGGDTVVELQPYQAKALANIFGTKTSTSPSLTPNPRALPVLPWSAVRALEPRACVIGMSTPGSPTNFDPGIKLKVNPAQVERMPVAKGLPVCGAQPSLATQNANRK